jgi:hypothetical protein
MAVEEVLYRDQSCPTCEKDGLLALVVGDDERGWWMYIGILVGVVKVSKECWCLTTASRSRDRSRSTEEVGIPSILVFRGSGMLKTKRKGIARVYPLGKKHSASCKGSVSWRKLSNSMIMRELKNVCGCESGTWKVSKAVAKRNACRHVNNRQITQQRGGEAARQKVARRQGGKAARQKSTVSS